ncbi:MAG: hypothetical protein NTX14_04155 [Candidatus Nealsonbacteria bacterium]|nr:hypothetical protein [Candidatus Nealsonbacteria bacterium]
MTDKEFADYQAIKNTPAEKGFRSAMAVLCLIVGGMFFLGGVSFLITTGSIGIPLIVCGGFLLFFAFMTWDRPQQLMEKIEADKKMGMESAPQDKIIYNLIYCVFIAGLIFTVAYVLISPVLLLGVIILLVGIGYGMMKEEFKKFLQNTIGEKTEPPKPKLYQPNEKQKPPAA